MRSYLSVILVITAVAAESSSDDRTKTTTKPDGQRDKRQLGNIGVGIPIYFDNFNANPPLEPVQPLQPLPPLPPLPPVQPLQPITVVNTPNVQSPGFLPGFPQNLPIVGTLLTNLPFQSLTNLLGGINLANLGQLGQLGNLGNLGQLGNLANLGGSKPSGSPGSSSSSSPAQTCPLTQKLTCRCESLLPLQVRKPASHLLQIIKQNVRHNEDGSSELRMVLSNGIIIYHRNEKDAIKQMGYYALPFQKEHYLNVHYNINQTNYTVKADMSSSAPKSDFEV